MPKDLGTSTRPPALNSDDFTNNFNNTAFLNNDFVENIVRFGNTSRAI